jgi:hypothetical protein
MAKAKAHGYFTDGVRLFRLEHEISGGRGVIMEDARTDEQGKAKLVSLSVKEFLQLQKVRA